MYQHQKDYPRPQLVREKWKNLNGEWEFAFDDKKEGLKDRWQENFPQGEKILVPFTYETKKSGIGRQEKHSRVWYERKLSLEKKEEKRYLLHFEGCDFYTKVWVNGELAGSHKGGYARFTFDVTELLIPGETGSLLWQKILMRSASPEENSGGEKKTMAAGMFRPRGSGRPSGWRKCRNYIYPV